MQQVDRTEIIEAEVKQGGVQAGLPGAFQGFQLLEQEAAIGQFGQ